jgi:hypothetical protein
MSNSPLEPIIVEPKGHSKRNVRPAWGEFVLHDSDFPVETDPKYAVPSGVAPLRVPHFPPGEVAGWAFGQSPEWMKTLLKGPPYKKTPLQLGPNEPLIIRIVARGRTGERRFTLADIERLAWALYYRNDIDGTDLQGTVEILIAVAELHRRREEKN